MIIKNFLFSIGLLSLASTISHGSYTDLEAPVEGAGGYLRALVIPVEEKLQSLISNMRREVTDTEIFDHRYDLVEALHNSDFSLTSVTYLRGSSQLRRVPYLISGIKGNVEPIDLVSKLYINRLVEYNKGSSIEAFFDHKTASSGTYPFNLRLRSCELTPEEKSVILEKAISSKDALLNLHFLKGTYRISYPSKTIKMLKKNSLTAQKIYLRSLKPFPLSKNIYLATFAYDDEKDETKSDGKLSPLPTFDLHLSPSEEKRKE